MANDIDTVAEDSINENWEGSEDDSDLIMNNSMSKKSPAVRCHSQINVVCLFIGFSYSYFLGSADFLLLIQQ